MLQESDTPDARKQTAQFETQPDVAALREQPNQNGLPSGDTLHCEISVSDCPYKVPQLPLSPQIIKRREELSIKQKGFSSALSPNQTQQVHYEGKPQASDAAGEPAARQIAPESVTLHYQQTDLQTPEKAFHQSRAADVAILPIPAEPRTDAENAVNMLRSDEVMLNFHSLKEFSKTRQAEQIFISSGQKQQLPEEDINISRLASNAAVDQLSITSRPLEVLHSAPSSSSSDQASEKPKDTLQTREQRSCKKERINYSQVHKGLPATPFTVNYNAAPAAQQIDQPPKEALASTQQELPQAEGNPSGQNQSVLKKDTRRTHEEMRKLFQTLTSFDWDLKDIKNLKQSPESLLTPIVFWFWLNSQYFPFDAQMTAEQAFESLFQEQILDKLQIEPQIVELTEDDKEPAFMSKLYVEENYFRLKDFLGDACPSGQQFDQMLDGLQQTLSDQVLQNQSTSLEVHSKFQHAYSHTEQTKSFLNAQNMLSCGDNFVAQVDQRYVEDIRENHEWYLENGSEVLLNINYPSRTEKEFLRQLEMWQQEKNEVNYKQILMQLQKPEDMTKAEDSRYQQLSAHKRGLVVQEDAQCAICNNGDYEDEDLIVFCGICNIPVHQRCYGIDEVPESDWICNNCSCLALKRGLQVKCVFCPKRGGAMKPTSVFSSYEHYQRYHTAAAKKKGLNSTTFLQIQKQESAQSNSKPTKAQLFEREDKNHSLSQILTRECNFQDALISQKRQAGEQFPQELVDLHFLQTETISESPEDYDFFLQRNQKIFESGLVPSTETLYEWIHLSCAMWIPGPIVTPKTPVRLNKIDHKRFNLQCIICGQKNEGACIQCQHSKCMISFHIECARRSNYFIQVDRVERERCYRIFCEKHRPLKIVKEQEERDRQAVEEVQRFARVLEKSLEINDRYQQKVTRLKIQTQFSKQPKQAQQNVILKKSHNQVLQQKRQEKLNQAKEKEVEKQKLLEAKRQARVEKDVQTKERERLRKEQREWQQKSHTKKWREKDKLCLLERIKTRYLQLIKMRMNVVSIDPLSKQLKQKERNLKRQQSLLQAEEKKRLKKQQSSSYGVQTPQPSERGGLRKRNAAQAQLADPPQLEQDIFQMSEVAATPVETPLECLEAYYKFGIPICVLELDWGITLSKYEFPWQDIAEGLVFSPKECYEKYISLVRDPQTFLKKVLNTGNIMRDKYVKLMQNQMNQPPRLIVQETVTVENEVYCLCKGSNQSGFFVACEAENDCPYGGWLHPECTEDLKNLSREVIDSLGAWYCFSCVQRMKQDDQLSQEAKDQQGQHPDGEEQAESESDSDNIRELEAELEADALIIQEIQNEIEQQSDEQAEAMVVDQAASREWVDDEVHMSSLSVESEMQSEGDQSQKGEEQVS